MQARVCGDVPSSNRNAWVTPKLRWLPSTKMAARTPQSDSTGENRSRNGMSVKRI